MAHTSLLFAKDVAACEQTQRTEIMSDFARARRHIVFIFSVKLSHWTQLPWILFGLGHANSDVARSCARRALNLYAAFADTHSHHPLTVLTCCPGSQGHAEMLSFIGGAEISDCPVLARLGAKCTFATIVERWIESRRHCT